MNELSTSDNALIAPIEQATMIAHTLTWARVNSGTHNVAGLGTMASLLADAFSVLPGDLALVDPQPAETIDAQGNCVSVPTGRHMVLRVRPDAKRRVLLTGHMDTVYAADDPFQHCEWLDDHRLRGPGVLDMKSGLKTCFKPSKTALIVSIGGEDWSFIRPV
jgi:glutamate carboxypeptidase